MELVRAEFSFLTAGPGFACELPAEFDRTPEISSPLLNGRGGRDFVFIPSYRVEPLGEGDDNSFIGQLEGRDGRPVDFFARVAPPPLWRLRWTLGAGCLYTHLREEDGAGMASTTVASISVIDDERTGLPHVLYYPPLEYGTSTWPGYQDVAIFMSSALGEGFTIAFERPGTLTNGQALVAERSIFGGLAVVRADLGDGVEVQVAMGGRMDAGEEVATAILDTFQAA